MTRIPQEVTIAELSTFGGALVLVSVSLFSATALAQTPRLNRFGSWSREHLEAVRTSSVA